MKVGDKVRFVRSKAGYEECNLDIKLGQIGKIQEGFNSNGPIKRIKFKNTYKIMFHSELELIHDIKYSPASLTNNPRAW